MQRRNTPPLCTARGGNQGGRSSLQHLARRALLIGKYLCVGNRQKSAKSTFGCQSQVRTGITDCRADFQNCSKLPWIAGDFGRQLFCVVGTRRARNLFRKRRSKGIAQQFRFVNGPYTSAVSKKVTSPLQGRNSIRSEKTWVSTLRLFTATGDCVNFWSRVAQMRTVATRKLVRHRCMRHSRHTRWSALGVVKVLLDGGADPNLTNQALG